ncbi:MAG: helix-turn-helix domain-containing protein [Bacteroidetes bacterium]|nr:helix-turn-helix domain-containing protein [Bacteroidota bacterium]MCL2302428.1 helix-turn-helix domain-containing protein [Lentimicrobiaceae bacterium]
MRNKIDIGELIYQKLKEQDRSIVWLAKKVSCDESNLGKMLKGKRYINPDLLFNIADALDEDFFVYYSKKLQEKKSRSV